jgi:hypothetical protein
MGIKITEEQAESLLEAMGISTENALSLPARIFEPLAKPSDLGLTPRELFYWSEKNILGLPANKGEPQRSWSRLNLLEVIWVRIVRELRKFNLSFAIIAKIKHALLEDALTKTLENPEAEIGRLTQNFKNKNDIDTVKEIFNQAKKHPELLPEKGKLAKTVLGSFLADILLFNSKITLHLYKINDNFLMVFEGCTMVKYTLDEIEQLKLTTRISLNLSELIAEFLTEDKFEKINTDFGLISEKELKILEAIRNKKVREIIIKKDQNETITLTTTSQNELRGEEVQMLKRILRMNEFDDVRAILRNDKNIYLENRTKVKLRPDNTAPL